MSLSVLTVVLILVVTNKFNPNWAAGAAWNVSEEDFMASLKTRTEQINTPYSNRIYW